MVGFSDHEQPSLRLSIHRFQRVFLRDKLALFFVQVEKEGK